MIEKISTLAGLKPGTARLAGQGLTLLHSERPKTVYNFGLSECNGVNLLSQQGSYRALRAKHLPR